MLLVKPPDNILGKKIDTDFRKWVRFGMMWAGPLTMEEKCDLTFLNILGEVPKDQEKWMDAILDFYQCGEKPRPGLPMAKERILDWKEDSPAIWADFRIYTGIDLDREKLHWWEFMALFRSLPPDALIQKRMEIRAVDLSKIKSPEIREDYRIRKLAAALDWQENYEDF